MVANEDHYTQGRKYGQRRKALIFDMDGTMFDTEPIFYRFWREISARYGYDLDRTVYDKIAGRDNVRTRFVCEEAFGPDYPYDKVCQEEVALQMDYYRHHDIPFKPGLCQLLDYAEKEGLLCAVASSSPPSMIEYLLERKGIASFFDVVQSGKEVPHGRLRSRIYSSLLVRSSVSCRDGLGHEDSENGILAAHRAGIPSIWIQDMVEIDKRGAGHGLAYLSKSCRSTGSA